MHAIALALLFAAPQDTPKVKSPLDEKIAAALKNHPDVKAAEAKRLLAEAELEQAKLAITQRVASAVSKVELAKARLIEAEEAAIIYDKILKMGGAASEIEKAQYAKARPGLIAAKAELAAAELELQQLVGKGGASEPKPADVPKAEAVNPKLPSGAVADKLEIAVLMIFALNFKDMEMNKAFEGLMTAAKLDDVAVRGIKLLGGDHLKTPPKFDKLIGRNSLDGWVQLFVDELNGNQKGLPDELKGKYDVYIREYGLLVERVDNAPKDAITLTEFARAVRAKKGAK